MKTFKIFSLRLLCLAVGVSFLVVMTYDVPKDLGEFASFDVHTLYYWFSFLTSIFVSAWLLESVQEEIISPKLSN